MLTTHRPLVINSGTRDIAQCIVIPLSPRTKEHEFHSILIISPLEIFLLITYWRAQTSFSLLGHSVKVFPVGPLHDLITWYKNAMLECW